MSVSQQIALRFVDLESAHLPEIMAIEREAYPDPWTVQMFQQEIQSKLSCFHVVFWGDALVGYGGFWHVGDEAHITSVTVRREYRRLGIGRRLVTHIIEEAARLGLLVATLEVRASNYHARNLYRSMGFEAVGRRKGYYAGGKEDAIIMAKELDDSRV